MHISNSTPSNDIGRPVSLKAFDCSQWYQSPNVQGEEAKLHKRAFLHEGEEAMGEAKERRR
jgi:hypothetical protein